jgi:hypothetical protein
MLAGVAVDDMYVQELMVIGAMMRKKEYSVSC